jgi:cell division protein FtsI/penicillin-binding protein 2
MKKAKMSDILVLKGITILSGKSGYLEREKDAHGAPILINGTQKVSAVSGVDLVTTIDKRIQILAEEKLKEGVEKYGAKGGSVTIMDPNTGSVLAMASCQATTPVNIGNMEIVTLKIL